MAEQAQAQENPGTAGAVGAGTPAQGAMFTQEDVNRIVQERLSRAKTQPDDAELAEFRKWKSSQKSQAEKDAEKAAELAAAQAEIASLKTQAKLAKAEVKPEFAEFVTAKVLAMEGKDVDANIKAFKKDNPQYFGQPVVVSKSTGVGLSGNKGGETTTNEIMNALFRNRGRVET